MSNRQMVKSSVFSVPDNLVAHTKEFFENLIYPHIFEKNRFLARAQLVVAVTFSKKMANRFAQCGDWWRVCAAWWGAFLGLVDFVCVLRSGSRAMSPCKFF